MYNLKKSIALGLMGSILLSTSVLAAPAAEQVLTKPINAVITSGRLPVTQANESVMITAKKIQEKNKNAEIEINIPVISGLTDQSYQEQLNYLVELHAMKDRENVETQGEEFAVEAQKQGWTMRPYSLTVNYDLKSNAEKYLSFTVTTYTYTGGANGITRVDYYNIDKKANKAFALQDLFLTDKDYKTMINKEIQDQIAQRLVETPSSYFIGQDGFQTISNSQGFYLKDGNLVVGFPKYSIAPGATGTPEFSIPLDNLIDLLKVEFLGDVRIIVNGVNIKTIIQDIDSKKVIMIPLRCVTDALGYKLQWNSQNQSIEIFNPWNSLKIGQNSYFFAKVAPFSLETAPVLINNLTYVPLSFVERVLNHTTIRNGDGASVITTQDIAIQR